MDPEHRLGGLPADDLDRLLALLDREGEVHGLETTLLRPDGSRIHVRISAQASRDGEGKVGAHGGAPHDITARAEQAERALAERAEQLARTAAALDRSNRDLDHFAYVASHDLKAPLRGISNLSRWIEEDAGDTLRPEARAHLDLLRARVQRMEGIIDGILEYSRVGRRHSRPEDVDLGGLVRDTLDLLRPPPGFQVAVAPGLPVLRGERARLQQVLTHLIGNAVKHHRRPQEGHVWVDAVEDGDAWRVRVRDDGPGIATRFHERIFAIFTTLEARDKVEGAGIGLALVKKIVEGQGGSVGIESDEGQGATFWFTWPKHVGD